MSNYDEVQNALSYIDSRDREVWFEVGAALKDEFGEDGFHLWDNWSQSAQNYKSQDAKSVWKSIKPGHIHIGSLFHYAKEGGYRPSKPYVPPTAEEQARRAAEALARQQAEEQARVEKQAAVKSNAQNIWSRAKPADPNHPYLTAKGITDPAAIAGLRQNPYKGDMNLLVPVMYDREIVNLQSINQDGNKRFLAGGQVKGGYAVVGDMSKAETGLVIAEGFATAGSIHQATGKPVIVAFNATNMVTVSERLANTLPPNIPVTIAVDNDASQTGIKKAQQAAAAFGGRATAIQPEFTMTQIQQYQTGKGVDEHGRPPLPSDFNDLHQLAGIDAVRSQMNVQQQQEHVMANPSKDFNGKDSVLEAGNASQTNETNSIEFGGQTIKPDHQAAEFSQYEFHDATADARYVFKTPEEMQAKADELGATAYFGRTHSGESVRFDKTAQGWEAPQNGQEAPKQEAPDFAPERRAESPWPSESDSKKAILDLNYDTPESIKGRYLVADGKYLSAANGTTVLFEDSGKKISTAKTDMQTINDMLEVAKAKGWDSIKLNGTPEFKQMMYVAAESQGIQTKGYKPTQADLALVDRLRHEKSLNGIENTTVPAPEIASAPVGQSPVATAPEHQANTPEKQSPLPEQTNGHTPKTEQDNDEKIRAQPDAAALSAAENLRAQGSLPSESQVNVSELADTDIGISPQGIGGNQVRAEVMHGADELKAQALDTGLVSAKANYMQKAGNLSKPNQARLRFFERATLDAIHGANDDVKQEAMRNYYEHTATLMNGSKLNLPNPVQIPSPSPSQSQTATYHPSQSEGHEAAFEDVEYGR